jgi:hypothetical protein
MSGSKRIAWDGISFLIPDNWELAIYKYLKKGVVRLEIEDEYAVRMEAEWIRPKRKLQMEHILARYEKKTKRLTSNAHHRKPIKGLPNGWAATHYTFAETVPKRNQRKGLQVVKHSLVTAFFLAPDSKLFCFVMLHFLPEDKEKPAEITRLVASEFRHHFDDPLTPWQLYDIAFEVPPGFLLENTLFNIGSKLMIFRWKQRRFYLWHLSCTDMFLKEDTQIEEWLAAHMNDARAVVGGSFFVDGERQIRWRRKRRHFLAHRDELSRWCFKYKAAWHLDREKKQLIAWVFSHRKPQDFEIIPEALRFGALPHS